MMRQHAAHRLHALPAQKYDRATRRRWFAVSRSWKMAALAGSLGIAAGASCVPIGTPCGGLAGAPCGAGLFCSVADGTCGSVDQMGVCAAVPQACIELFAPVCGCDGKTYSNACFAAAASVSIQRDGACASGDDAVEGELCGGIAGIACGTGLFCRFEGVTCGSGDQSGVCAITPEVCTDVVDPVCGCDRRTYPNECRAEQAGVSVSSLGACP